MKKFGFGDEAEVTKWDTQHANSVARNARSRAAAAERAREEEESKKQAEASKEQRKKRAENRGGPGDRKLVGTIRQPKIRKPRTKDGKGSGGK